jgi:hypothetical protein
VLFPYDRNDYWIRYYDLNIAGVVYASRNNRNGYDGMVSMKSGLDHMTTDSTCMDGKSVNMDYANSCIATGCKTGCNNDML